MLEKIKKLLNEHPLVRGWEILGPVTEDQYMIFFHCGNEGEDYFYQSKLTIFVSKTVHCYRFYEPAISFKTEEDLYEGLKDYLYLVSKWRT